MYNINGYIEAGSVKEAVQLLSENENAQIIAGGTDVLIKTRESKTGYVGRDLIGITRIEELLGVKLDSEENVIIGAAMTFTNVETNPIILDKIPTLGRAVGNVGGPQTRNVGTIGGNICNGATSDFYLGPGKVALEQGDILVSIKVTKENYEGFKGHYVKFSPRKAMDIATLGCSILIKEENNIIKELRIAFGVAGPTPIRASEAEEFAKEKAINEENLDAIGDLCLKSSNARDSWRGSKAFREQLVKELPKRAVMTAIGGTNV